MGARGSGSTGPELPARLGLSRLRVLGVEALDVLSTQLYHSHGAVDFSMHLLVVLLQKLQPHILGAEALVLIMQLADRREQFARLHQALSDVPLHRSGRSADAAAPWAQGLLGKHLRCVGTFRARSRCARERAFPVETRN